MRYLHILRWTSAVAMSMCCAVASATMATYDFTGFVGLDQGSAAVPLQTPVSGSFTIDYDAAIPGQGSGTFNSPTGPWSVASNGLPSTLVFSENVTIGGITYSTNPLSTYLNHSQIVGGNQQFTGATTLYSDANDSISLDWGVTYGVGYLSNGLPDLSHASLAAMFGTYSYARNNGTDQGSVIWAVSTLTPAPVPVPGAAWLLISGLGALGALGRRSSGWKSV